MQEEARKDTTQENPLFEVMTELDEIDRQAAREELAAGASLDLKEAMDSW